MTSERDAIHDDHIAKLTAIHEDTVAKLTARYEKLVEDTHQMGKDYGAVFGVAGLAFGILLGSLAVMIAWRVVG